MSYHLEVLKDCPQTLYLLGSNANDASGHAVASAFYGTPEYSSAPLVANQPNAHRWHAGSLMSIPFPYMEPGYERQAFTLENWFFPIGGTILLAAHGAGETDGLMWIGGSMYFSLHFTTAGYIRLQYTPPTVRNMHVVGVFNGEKMELWVNGELVDSLGLTDAQKADTYATQTYPGLLWSGNAEGVQQALATYYTALSPMQIRNHYNAGKMSVNMNTASGLFGGVREKINNDTADIFLDVSYSNATDWAKGSGTALIGDIIKSPIDTTGAYVAGSWDAAIPLDQGGTSISHMTIDWVGKGILVMYTSLDGITWTAQNNSTRIAGISAGYNPTGKILRIRATFAAGSYGEVQSIDIHGYKTMNVTPATRPVTMPALSQFYEENPIMDYNIVSGFYGAAADVTIGPTADSQAFQTVSLWYYAIAGSLTLNVTPDTFYENNVARAVRTRAGEWVHVVFVIPAKTDALTINLYGWVTAPTLFSGALTAAQVDTLYKSYTGIPRTVVDCATPIQVAGPSATIYANDWSITGAG